jgi:hypothetical protein
VQSIHIYYLAQIAACQARIAAMQALNDHRRDCGTGQAYGEEAFQIQVDELERIAQNVINT